MTWMDGHIPCWIRKTALVNDVHLEACHKWSDRPPPPTPSPPSPLPILGPIIFNIFNNDLDKAIKFILIKFLDKTKIGGNADG